MNNIDTPNPIETVKVVTIKTDNGPVRINHSDFDPATHELHEQEDTPLLLPGDTVAPIDQQQSAPVSAEVTARNDAIIAANYGVVENDKKFYVINTADGQIVSNVDGIDVAGYKTNKAAWAALMSVKAKAGATS